MPQFLVELLSLLTGVPDEVKRHIESLQRPMSQLTTINRERVSKSCGKTKKVGEFENLEVRSEHS